jgi:hypothetical protein
VTIELILLALATAIRPTSLAVVYALLASGSPRRLMVAYVAAGLAFTIAIGLLVIWAFSGIDIRSGSGPAKGVAEIIGGSGAIVFGVLVLTRRIGGGRPVESPRSPGRWNDLLERHLTLRNAALAGPATHIPGLFYLIALNLIVARDPDVPRGVLQLLIYNAVWFVLPLAALVICMTRPDLARDAVGAVQAWAKRNARTIVLTIAFGVGAAMIISGALTV